VVSPTHGVLTVGGAIAFILGSFLLFNTPEGAPFLQVSIPVILGVATVLVGFSVFAVGAVARTRRRKVVTGREGLIGSLAEVRTPLNPTGLVHLESELWRARTTGRAVEPGERVRVVAVAGLDLSVAPEETEAVNRDSSGETSAAEGAANLPQYGDTEGAAGPVAPR
jgi:membrane-bound serine protease (ClpP class)